MPSCRTDWIICTSFAYDLAYAEILNTETVCLLLSFWHVAEGFSHLWWLAIWQRAWQQLAGFSTRFSRVQIAIVRFAMSNTMSVKSLVIHPIFFINPDSEVTVAFRHHASLISYHQIQLLSRDCGMQKQWSFVSRPVMNIVCAMPEWPSIFVYIRGADRNICCRLGINLLAFSLKVLSCKWVVYIYKKNFRST